MNFDHAETLRRREKEGANFSIVLAAGMSTRMGICKSSLVWDGGKTLLTYQLEQWLKLGFTPLVVLGSHNSHRQQDCLNGSLVVVNDHASTGKTSSILAGLKQIPQNFEILAISAVDQPREFNIYQQLLEAHQANSALMTAPTHQGKMGHPLLFANDMRSHLINIREETLGLRQVIKDFYPLINKVEFSNPDVLLDINTPEIYQQYSV